MGIEPLFRGAMPIFILFRFSAESHVYLPLLAALFKLCLRSHVPRCRYARSVSRLFIFILDPCVDRIDRRGTYWICQP